MRSIVVTGALGHIGSSLIGRLPTEWPDAEVTLLDNLSTQRYPTLFELPDHGRYRFLESDIRDVAWERILDGADAVVHLAAITDAPSTVNREEETHEVNCAGTVRLAEACARYGVPLLFPSTTSVYGPQSDEVDEDCDAEELRPQSPYAMSKLLAEDELSKLAETSGLRFVTVRCGTIYGPSMGMRFHTVVQKFCWQAVLEQPLTVWEGALDQVRPYLALEDAVEAMVLLVRQAKWDCRTYNVVTSNHTVAEVVEAVRGIVPTLQVTYSHSAILNQLSYRVSGARIGAIGFSPTGSLKRGVADTVRYIRNANRPRCDQGRDSA